MPHYILVFDTKYKYSYNKNCQRFQEVRFAKIGRQGLTTSSKGLIIDTYVRNSVNKFKKVIKEKQNAIL